MNLSVLLHPRRKSRRIQRVPASIHHLSNQDRCDDVFSLYRKDSGKLGFMPRGAFEEGIVKGTLLVATDGQDQILGYPPQSYRYVGSDELERLMD